MTEEGTRVCRKCGAEKPVGEFCRGKFWDNTCLACHRAYQRDRLVKRCAAEGREYHPHLGTRAEGREPLGPRPAVGRMSYQQPETRTCRQCGETKPAERFTKYGKYRRNTCKDCHKAEVTKAYAEKRQASGLPYDPQMADPAPEGMKTCRRCMQVYPATREFFYLDRRYDTDLSYCRPCMRALTKAYNDKLRLEVLSHYSDGALRCACPWCDEDNPDLLSIDHVHGGGLAHRREIGTSGSRLYVWLKTHDWPGDGRDGRPKEYQVLCLSCNLGREFHGGPNRLCPHEIAARASGLGLIEDEEEHGLQ